MPGLTGQGNFGFIFGDGSDGAFSASSGITTLTRDVFYTTLSLSGTAQIKCNGYRVYVRDICTIDSSGRSDIYGLLHNNGTNGSGRSNGVGGPAGYFGAGQDGGSGSRPAISQAAGSGSNINNSLGGAGGDGGIGDGSIVPTHGTGSTITNVNWNAWGITTSFRSFWTGMLGIGISQVNSSNYGMQGGGGGGGGGGNPTGDTLGGGGGGGAGCFALFANYLVLTGGFSHLSAVGGNGDVPSANVTPSGGGGGGGGGCIFLAYGRISGSLHVNVSGGTGAAGHGASGTGGNGGSGFFTNYQL